MLTRVVGLRTGRVSSELLDKMNDPHSFQSWEPSLANVPGGAWELFGYPSFDWELAGLNEVFDDTLHIELKIGPIDNPVLHTPSCVSLAGSHS